MGFDWNDEEEWKQYLNEIEMLYRAMHRYIAMVSYLRSLNGTGLTYATAKTTVFNDMLTQPVWREFVRDFYEVEIAEMDTGYGENYRVVWKGGPVERFEDWGIIELWSPGVYATVLRAYAELSNVGFAAEDMSSNLEKYDVEEALDAVEELIRRMVSLSPLINRKTFFVLSLRYLPEGYAKMMYGEIDTVENLMNWKRITSWPVISTACQICTITDPRWRHIADALNALYGYSGNLQDMDSVRTMWNCIEKYTGENPYKLYFEEALKRVGQAYKENAKLSAIVRGSWLPAGDAVYAEAVLESLSRYLIKNWNVADESERPEVEMKYDALIKFAAPQFFMNIGSMYLNPDGEWVLGLYIPLAFMNESKNIAPSEMDVVHVSPVYMPQKVLLPDGWRLHRLRDFLQTMEFYLECMAMQTPEWEDYGGE